MGTRRATNHRPRISVRLGMTLVATLLLVVFFAGTVVAKTTSGWTLKVPASVPALRPVAVSGVVPRTRLTRSNRVVLQERVGGRWVSIVTSLVRRSRHFSLRFTPPSGTAVTIRVRLVHGTRRLSTSPVRRLRLASGPGQLPGGSPITDPSLTPPSPITPGPTPAPVSNIATSDGGSVAVQLGSVRVDAPAGAIAAGETLSLTSSTPPADLKPEGASSIAGGPFELSSSQGQPNAPVTVTFGYDRAALSEGAHPLLLHGLAAAGAWIPEETTDDTTAHVATATLDSFSPIDWADSGLYYVGLFTGNRASAPDDCAADPPSWVQDVSLPNSHEVQLPTCFTTDSNDSKAVIHMVNNRGYAMRVTVYGAKFDLEKSEFSDSLEGQVALDLAAATPTGDPQTFVIAPLSSAKLTITKPPDQPPARMVTIDPVMTASAGAFASVAWAILATVRDEVGLPAEMTDCVVSAAYNVSGEADVASALDQVHHCADAAAAGLSKEKGKALKKIAYALAAIDVLYKVRDLRADALFPPQIGFTIKGTGIVNDAITVGPYDLGMIAPGHTYPLQLTASGGTAPYEFHIYTGDTNGNDPPPWASLNSSGMLTLAPPADDNASYRFYVYAFDAHRQHEPFARDTVKVATGDGEAPFFDRPSVLFPTVSQGAWTTPMADDGQIFPRVDGSVITTKCTYHNPSDANAQFAIQQLAPDGSMQWRRPDYEGAGCIGLTTDPAGNTYYFTSDALGAHIRSLAPDGQVRWTSAPLGSYIDRVYYTGPALGSDGDVYFPLYNAYGTGYLVRVDEDTGALLLIQVAGFPTSLFAYSGGLIMIGGNGPVEYLNYDGSEKASYGIPDIEFDALGKVGSDGNGNVFLAGGSTTNCNHGPSNDAFVVVKMTPTGKAWEWTDPASNGCERGSATATPNGGVVVTESPGGSTNSYVTALDQNGHVLWRTAISSGATLVPPLFADTAGVVAVPADVPYTCAGGGGTCAELEVSFVNQNTGATALPRIMATNESYTQSTGGDPWGNVAITTNRIYVGASPYLDNDTYQTSAYGLAALAVPGLSNDYERTQALAVAVGP